MKRVLLLLLVLALPVVGFARNDFWLGNRYSVALSFGASDLGKKNSPTPRTIALPEYPVEMIRISIGGEVTFDYTVTLDGRVTDLVVVKASSDEFQKAASAAVHGWIFNPAIDLASGGHVEARMRCKVRFLITDEEEPNKALEPTTPAVTPAACAPVAPAGVAAQL